MFILFQRFHGIPQLGQGFTGPGIGRWIADGDERSVTTLFKFKLRDLQILLIHIKQLATGDLENY